MQGDTIGERLPGKLQRLVSHPFHQGIGCIVSVTFATIGLVLTIWAAIDLDSLRAAIVSLWGLVCQIPHGLLKLLTSLGSVLASVGEWRAKFPFSLGGGIFLLGFAAIGAAWLFYNKGRRGQLIPSPFREWVISLERIIHDHRGHRHDAARHFMKKFIFSYAQEEERHVSGRVREGETQENPAQKRIYTSFVSYSEIVGALMEKPDLEDIVCLATISMPLPQWFNNRIDFAEQEEFRYTAIDPDWKKYLSLMHRLAHTNNGTTVYRILNVFEGDSGRFPYWSETLMKERARMQILLRADEFGNVRYSDWEYVKPFTREERERCLGGVSSGPLQEAVRRFTAEECYLIVPKEIATGAAPPPGSKWVSIGDAFRSMFGPTDGVRKHAFAYRIDEDIYLKDFAPDQGIPNDIFLIGHQRAHQPKPEWLFYLAGTTDEACKMVRLEYGTEVTDGERVQHLRTAYDKLLDVILHGGYQGTQLCPLEEWLH